MTYLILKCFSGLQISYVPKVKLLEAASFTLVFLATTAWNVVLTVLGHVSSCEVFTLVRS